MVNLRQDNWPARKPIYLVHVLQEVCDSYGRLFLVLSLSMQMKWK